MAREPILISKAAEVLTKQAREFFGEGVKVEWGLTGYWLTAPLARTYLHKRFNGALTRLFSLHLKRSPDVFWTVNTIEGKFTDLREARRAWEEAGKPKQLGRVVEAMQHEGEQSLRTVTLG